MFLNLTVNKNKLYKTFRYWSRDMLNFDFLKKGLGIVSPPGFVYDYEEKSPRIIFYQLAKFYWVIAFTSWDSGQYVYWNCLLNRL